MTDVDSDIIRIVDVDRNTLSVIDTNGRKYSIFDTLLWQGEDYWDFICNNLDCYSWDEEVALSNDLAVLIETGGECHDEEQRARCIRECGNDPDKWESMQREVDADLMLRAIADYLK